DGSGADIECEAVAAQAGLAGRAAGCGVAAQAECAGPQGEALDEAPPRQAGSEGLAHAASLLENVRTVIAQCRWHRFEMANAGGRAVVGRMRRFSAVKTEMDAALYQLLRKPAGRWLWLADEHVDAAAAAQAPTAALASGIAVTNRCDVQALLQQRDLA